MLANWIHAMIVHLVVIGTPLMLIRVLVHKKKALDGKQWKNTFSVLLLLAIIASIAYFTGPRAADWVKEIFDSYNQDLMEDHGLWGRIAFVIQVIAGLIGVVGWASILQEEMPDRRIPIILIILLSAATLVLIYTAHLGGLIRRVDLMF